MSFILSSKEVKGPLKKEFCDLHALWSNLKLNEEVRSQVWKID